MNISSFLTLVPYHSTAAKLDMLQYEMCLDKYFSSRGWLSFRFERAMVRTAGNNHMHSQTVPLTRDVAARLYTSFEQLSASSSIHFMEVPVSIVQMKFL